MAINKIPINIDLKNKKFNNYVAQQNDNMLLDINIIENGVAKDLSKETLIVNYVNANNTIAVISGENVIVNGNNVKISCPNDCSRSNGQAKFSLVIKGADGQVSTYPIDITIEKGVIDGQAQSENIATIIEDLNNASLEVTQKKNELEDVIKTADTTTYATKGEINGVKSSLEEKVNKEQGKGLSTNNYDNNEKSEVAKVKNKADISYVDTKVGQIVSGSPKGTYASLSALQIAKPTGDTGIYVTQDNGHWYFWNGTAWTEGGIYQASGIADKSITQDKTTFYKPHKNLFNKRTVIEGSYLDGTGNPSTGYPTYAVSVFIDVLPSTTYYCGWNFTNFYAYDASGVKIQELVRPSFTTPSNCYKVRCTIPLDKLDVAQLEIGTVATEYEEYNMYLDTDLIAENSLEGSKLKDIDGSKITDRTLNIKSLEYFTQGKNLFNKDTAIQGKTINFNNGSLMNGADYFASDFIEIIPGVKITERYKVETAFYDKDKKYIMGFSRPSDNSTIQFSCTTPDNAKYMRVGIYKSLIDLMQIEYGEVFTAFESYNYRLKYLYYPSDTNKNTFRGKILCTYGDSITASGMWQKYVIDKFEFGKHYNRGWSDSNVTMSNQTLYINADGTYNSNPASTPVQPEGTTEVNCSFCHDDRIAYVPTDCDVILIMGGTNDCMRAKPIGDCSYPYDESTFKGALCSTFKKIQDKCPNALIVLMTPINRAKAKGSDEPFVHSVSGLMTKDYAQAVREVAEYIGCPLIDVFTQSGMTLHNTNQTSADGIHPNELGCKTKIAPCVIGGLKWIMPVE